MVNEITSMERVLKTLNHSEADRIPLFLPLSIYGSKELGMTVKEYFNDYENVLEAQIRMRKKYGNDFYDVFNYAAIEFEAWGGEVIFSDDGPPNAGEPIIHKNSNIGNLKIPDIKESKNLLKILKTIEALKNKSANTVPIVGVVVAPSSLPIMQMGFDNYIDVMLEQPEFFNALMKINSEFCINWANAQIEAGAAAICYFDGVSSTSIITEHMYNTLIHDVTKRALKEIKGPVAIHTASGRCMPILDKLMKTGATMIGVSCNDDIGRIKDACKNKLTVIGNLNGIEMCRWKSTDAENAVKEIITKAGKGGGLIISDNHGEIPLQVSEDVLLTISETMKKSGTYPLALE